MTLTARFLVSSTLTDIWLSAVKMVGNFLTFTVMLMLFPRYLSVSGNLIFNNADPPAFAVIKPLLSTVKTVSLLDEYCEFVWS